MVGRADLANAVSLNSATFNSARIVGPALAGVLIAVTDTGWVFLGNAVLTLAVIAGLLLMRPDELHRSPPTGRSPGQLREGLRYVRSRPDLLLPMALVFVVGTFGLNFPVTMALMAREVFGHGAAVVRAAVHRDRGRLAGRRARVHPADQPADHPLPDRRDLRLRPAGGAGRRDADVRVAWWCCWCRPGWPR